MSNPFFTLSLPTWILLGLLLNVGVIAMTNEEDDEVIEAEPPAAFVMTGFTDIP